MMSNTFPAISFFRVFRPLPSVGSVGLILLMLGSCAQKQSVALEDLDQLGSACQTQMIASTCQAMKPVVGEVPRQGEVVFVAGVGPVDAQLLAKLSAAGQAMCEEVKATCATGWNGQACMALRKMYPPTLVPK